MIRTAKSRVLCVDDERMILEGLALHLQRRFEVVTAESGPEGLEIIQRLGNVAVVLSDMRMPGMNGAEFLAKVRTLSPSTVRILLTGHADFDSALAAINQGQIFRFLTKPCPASLMAETVEAAAQQHRLIDAEKVLLEQTLAGSIRTLTEILSLASPIAFGRAVRVKRYASELCDALGVKDRWAVELAAQLSHIGFITLPATVAEKVYYGQALEPSELEMVAKVPALSEQLLANIPRLEPVREIIMAQGRLFDGSDAPWTLLRGEELPLGARILKIVIDLDALEAAGASNAQALNTLAQRAGHYDPKILETLAKAQGARVQTREARDLPVKGLKEGMVLAEDVRMKNGTLLIARGYTVSGGLLERLKNIPDGAVKEPVRVIAGQGPEA